MKKNSYLDLQTPQLQSPVAMILILYKFFVLVLKNAFPIILVLFLNKDSSRDNFEIYIVLGISFISSILSIAAYYKFKYYIKDDEVVINKGILKKINLNVPFDRIQSINTNQNLIHRIFNVASLEIDTAGSKNNEIKIDAISIDKANQLKEYILNKKAQFEPSTDSSEIVEPAFAIEKELLHLDIPALIKVGIGQNHFRSLTIIGLFMLGLSQYSDIIFSKKEYSDLTDQAGSMAMNFILVLVPVLLIATFIFTLFRTVLKYYDLRFKESKKGYRLVSGLFTRNEKQANFQKIQLVGWHTNPLKKLFNMFELNLSQAFSSSMVRSQTMQIPGMYQGQLESVCESYFPEANRLDFQNQKVSARLMIRVFSQLAIIIVVLGLVKWVYPPFYVTWPMLGVSILFALIYTYVSWAKWEVKFSAHGLLIRRGFLRTSFTLLRWEKIQGLRSRQSIFQKRHQLTDLHVFTAAGTIKIPYLKELMFNDLQDYLLYYVETNHEPWM